jgi:CRP/FNR family cyclic AMP-dependent transcriptional regulator
MRNCQAVIGYRLSFHRSRSFLSHVVIEPDERLAALARLCQSSGGTRNAPYEDGGGVERPREGPPRRGTMAEPTWAALNLAGTANQIVKYARGAIIFRQGDTCDRVLYIQEGVVKVSVVSTAGREAIIAVLRRGDFLGEEGLVGQRFRTDSASAITPSTIVLITTANMGRLLHQQPETSQRFIAHVLSRNIRSENDLLDQLLNSAEQRLARKLLMLSGGGGEGEPEQILPWLTQETLADMVGTTRSRVNMFLREFKRLGFIHYRSNGSLVVNQSLLRMVLDEGARSLGPPRASASAVARNDATDY